MMNHEERAECFSHQGNDSTPTPDRELLIDRTRRSSLRRKQCTVKKLKLDLDNSIAQISNDLMYDNTYNDMVITDGST